MGLLNPRRARVVAYLCGAFTANDIGSQAFHKEAAEALGYKARGLGVVTLIPHIAILAPLEPGGAGWKVAMLECIEHVRRADALLMISGWEHSRGARIEHWLAKRWGIPVFYGISDLQSAIPTLLAGVVAIAA